MFKDLQARIKERVQNEGKIVLRPSSIQQFVRCPHQWMRVHLLGEKVAPAAAARAGNALHSAFEYGFTVKRDKGELPPLDEVLDAAVQEWKRLNESEELKYNDKESFELYQADIVQSVTKYYEEMMPYIEPVMIEQRFTVEIDNPVIKVFSGSADLVIKQGETLHLVDYKFTRRPTQGSHYLLQQNSYVWLARENDVDLKSSVLHNIVRPTTRTDVRLNVLEIDFKERYLKFWVNIMLNALTEFYENGTGLLTGGSDPVTNYLCNPKWCGFWDECPFVAGLRDEEELKIKL